MPLHVAHSLKSLFQVAKLKLEHRRPSANSKRTLTIRTEVGSYRSSTNSYQQQQHYAFPHLYFVSLNALYLSSSLLVFHLTSRNRIPLHKAHLRQNLA